jgi:hypothetical protein
MRGNAPSSEIDIRLQSATMFSVYKFIDAPRLEIMRHPMDVRGLHRYTQAPTPKSLNQCEYALPRQRRIHPAMVWLDHSSKLAQIPKISATISGVHLPQYNSALPHENSPRYG